MINNIAKKKRDSNTPETIIHVKRSKLTVKLFSFNLLISSFLDDYIDYPDEIHDTSKRYNQLLIILEEQIKQQSIIALQEVENDFRNLLLQLSIKYNYVLKDVQYGNLRNNYIGIALLWPSCYELENFKQIKVADAIKLKYYNEYNSKKKCYNFCGNLYSSLKWIYNCFCGCTKKTINDFSYAISRHNWLLMVKLRDPKTGEIFTTANYHMPYTPWSFKVTKMHGETALELVQAFSGTKQIDNGEYIETRQNPMFFMGDFNSKKTDDLYNHYSQTCESSFKRANKEEIDWTCWTVREKNEIAEELKNTIDYIWLDKDNKYTVIVEAAKLNEKLPTKDYPSDHKWIGAIVTFL